MNQKNCLRSGNSKEQLILIEFECATLWFSEFCLKVKILNFVLFFVSGSTFGNCSKFSVGHNNGRPWASKHLNKYTFF